MGDAMILRRGGGAIKLKVKAYTSAVNLPETASLNEIGVITSTAISTVYAQADQPSNPGAGDVWFKLSYNSSIALNLAKTGALKIYPLFAKQYVSGAWVFVDAYAYYNGTWNKFIQYLYFEGGEYIERCGGWQQGGIGTLTKYATYMEIYCPSSVGAASFRTVNMLDVTDLTMITLRYFMVSSMNQYSKFGLFSSPNIYNSAGQYLSLPSSAIGLTKTAAFDVSAKTGLWYIGFSMNSQQMTIRILEITAY